MVEYYLGRDRVPQILVLRRVELVKYCHPHNEHLINQKRREK